MVTFLWLGYTARGSRPAWVSSSSYSVIFALRSLSERPFLWRFDHVSPHAPVSYLQSENVWKNAFLKGFANGASIIKALSNFENIFTFFLVFIQSSFFFNFEDVFIVWPWLRWTLIAWYTTFLIGNIIVIINNDNNNQSAARGGTSTLITDTFASTDDTKWLSKIIFNPGGI